MESLERPLGYLCKAAVSYGLMLHTVDRLSDLEPHKIQAAQLRHVNPKLYEETTEQKGLLDVEDRRLQQEKQKYESDFASSLRASAEELAKGVELMVRRSITKALSLQQAKPASTGTEKQVLDLASDVSKLQRDTKNIRSNVQNHVNQKVQNVEVTVEAQKMYLRKEQQRAAENLDRLSRELSAFKFEVRESAKTNSFREHTDALQKQLKEAREVAEESRKESAELKKVLEGTRKTLKSRADAAYSRAEDANTMAAEAQRYANSSYSKAEQAHSKAEQSLRKAEYAKIVIEQMRAEYEQIRNENTLTSAHLREQVEQLVRQAGLGIQASGGGSLLAIEPPPPPQPVPVSQYTAADSANDFASSSGNGMAPPRLRRFSDDIKPLPIGFPDANSAPLPDVSMSKNLVEAAGRATNAIGDRGASWRGGEPGPAGSGISRDGGIAELQIRIVKLENDFTLLSGEVLDVQLPKLVAFPKRMEKAIKAVASTVQDLQEE
ncbi:hypothetical protein HDU86_008550, partial [Geranomyces michiganensis]